MYLFGLYSSFRSVGEIIGRIDYEERLAEGFEPNGRYFKKMPSAAKLLHDQVCERLIIDEHSRCMSSFEFAVDF